MSLRARAPGRRWFDGLNRYEQALVKDRIQTEVGIFWDRGDESSEARIVKAELCFGEYTISAEAIENAPRSDEVFLQMLRERVDAYHLSNLRSVNWAFYGHPWPPYLSPYQRGRRFPRRLKKRQRNAFRRLTDDSARHFYAGNVTCTAPGYQGRIARTLE